MEHVLDSNDRNQEAGEEHLAKIIKQTGNDARTRKWETLAHHYESLKLISLK